MSVEYRLILGDQLNLNHSWFRETTSDVVYLMFEQKSETSYVTHHAQKIIAVFSSMRAFGAELVHQGHELRYVKISDEGNAHNFLDNILHQLKTLGAKDFAYQAPDEFRLEQELDRIAQRLKKDYEITTTRYSTEHFIVEDWGAKKLPVMERFYREMRKKTSYLMDGDMPSGGSWNYDTQNRSPIKSGQEIPEPWTSGRDESELWKEISESGIEYFGEPRESDFPWPLNRVEAEKVLDSFIHERLESFGKYQDAMKKSAPYLFHSLLSYALNTKMLSPTEVIEKAIESCKDQIPENTQLLASLEGFVRQILGWREYMRLYYSIAMPELAEKNFFQASRKLPSWYWDAQTDMNCMRESTGQSLELAYAHHIQRLMITGTFALIAGINPGEVDQWYLGIYIDAFEWVEITNTRGMSQFADGGAVATKPYAASASYVNRMSDYCKSCSYDHKKRHGEAACPFNSLYWDFLHRNREQLASNHRLSFAYKNLDRFHPDEKKAILDQAKVYLNNLDRL
jgi:deoxyribodipyrimidine photolyase-related protein